MREFKGAGYAGPAAGENASCPVALLPGKQTSENLLLGN